MRKRVEPVSEIVEAGSLRARDLVPPRLPASDGGRPQLEQIVQAELGRGHARTPVGIVEMIDEAVHRNPLPNGDVLTDRAVGGHSGEPDRPFRAARPRAAPER